MAQISGAVDLSKLGKPTGGSSGGTPGVYVTEVTEATFEATVRKSVQYPVVLEFYSLKAPESAQMGKILAELANAAGGSWLLARMNIDNAPQIVQALQIRAVPMVVGVLGGQLVSLWQGSMPKENAEKVIAELLKMAAGNGILGKAESQGPAGAGAAGAEEPPEDPRYTAAYDAMEKGDFAAAETEFARLLKDSPGDQLAKIGRAQAGLLARVAVMDPEQVMARAAAPDAGLDALMDAADIEVVSGQVEQGFARLTAAIAASAGAERDRLRTRIIELFDTQDPSDKVVLTARRNLSTALF